MTAFKNPRPLILEDIKSITEEMLIELDEKNRTWLHDAACNDYLQEIPKKFLTSERLNKKDKLNRSVWHLAARKNRLYLIPSQLFSNEAFKQADDFGKTVWDSVADEQVLDSIPLSLITEELLEMKDSKNTLLFTGKCINYIKKCLQVPSKLNDFITANPDLAKEIIHRDPRLLLLDVKENSVYFQFDAIDEQIVLNIKGVFIDDVNHETLCKAVSFIEKTYENVEQSITLPKYEALTVEKFVL